MKDVVADDALGDQDRILEVVALPRHEGDEHVAAQRQLAELVDGPSAMMSPRFDLVAHLHQRPLGDAGVLVGTLELQQVVDVDAGSPLEVSSRGRADDDAGRVDLIDDAAAPGGDGTPESRATTSSMPVPTSGASV